MITIRTSYVVYGRTFENKSDAIEFQSRVTLSMDVLAKLFGLPADDEILETLAEACAREAKTLSEPITIGAKG